MEGRTIGFVTQRVSDFLPSLELLLSESVGEGARCSSSPPLWTVTFAVRDEKSAGIFWI